MQILEPSMCLGPTGATVHCARWCGDTSAPHRINPGTRDKHVLVPLSGHVWLYSSETQSGAKRSCDNSCLRHNRLVAGVWILVDCSPSSNSTIGQLATAVCHPSIWHMASSTRKLGVEVGTCACMQVGWLILDYQATDRASWGPVYQRIVLLAAVSCPACCTACIGVACLQVALQVHHSNQQKPSTEQCITLQTHMDVIGCWLAARWASSQYHDTSNSCLVLRNQWLPTGLGFYKSHRSTWCS
jgi:hypothetical protein